MTADDLLAITDDLARRDVGRPRQASLKRAVSTAYYALFHAIARECVAQTVGWHTHAPDHWKVVTPIYRTMDHGGARIVFQRIARATTASSGLRALAEAFVDLQAARVRADYDPEPAFSRKDAVMSVDRARQAVMQLRSLPDGAKRLLIVQLIAKPR